MMRIKVLIGSVFCVVLFGCTKVISVCPDFPPPSQEVLDEIKSLQNEEVDEWIKDLYRLNLKLQYCQGD